MSRRYPKELIQFVKDHGHEGTIEEMAERIRLGQANQLDIIASHDAIRGMLVDIYM